MAIPDPHMNELSLISYEPRHRACKVIYKVPRRGDYIEVLWCLDYLPDMPDRWCPAEVLHITGTPEQDFLARGVIRYIPSDAYEERCDNVDFLDKHKLRCSANEEDDEGQDFTDCESTKNDNPCLEWQFGTEPPENGDTDSDDDIWCAQKFPDVRSQQGKTLTRVCNGRLNKDYTDVEIKALRNGHASLIVEVEKLKRELVRVSHHLASLQKTEVRHPKCTSASCVLPRMRQKLALKMQGSVRQAPTRKRKRDDPDQDMSIGYVDGVYPGLIRARVECTLQQFESLSRQIRTVCCTKEVFFFPGFSYTQLQLLCSSEFRVLFKTFSQLCDTIGISSSSDKKEMARKSGKGPQEDVLRLLGTYCYDDDNEQGPAHFFPGTSCGASLPEQLAPPTPDAPPSEKGNKKADPLFPVLTRRTRERDRVDSRFKHALRKESLPLPALTERCSGMHAFALVWREQQN